MNRNHSPSVWMEDSVSETNMRRAARKVAAVIFGGAAALGLGPAGAAALAGASLPAPLPAVSDYQYLSATATPPTEADCFSVPTRCFTSTSMQNSYNLPPLYAAGNESHGVTLAIIDPLGNPHTASDLANLHTQMRPPHT